MVLIPFFFDDPFRRTMNTVLTSKSGQTPSASPYGDMHGTVLVAI